MDSSTDRQKHVCVFTLHPVNDMRVFRRQILSLVKHGYRVTFIGKGDGEPYEDRGVHIRPMNWERRSRLGWLGYLFRLTRAAIKTRADIYHFHDPDLLPFAVWVRLRTWRPMIYDIHEYYRVKWQLRAKNPIFRWLIKFVVGAVEDTCAMLIHNISAVYADMAEHLRRLGCNVVVTPNYASRVLYSEGTPTDEEWEQRRHKLVYVGAVNPTRGARVMIDAAQKAREQIPDLKLIITRRFYYKEHEREVLEQLAQPGFENLVEFVPDTPGDELPAVVRMAEVGISPLQDEGQYRIAIPSKFFDYMGESLAIIASDLPPSRTYVQDVGCGVLVPPADVDAYARAIVDLMSNPKRLRELGRIGREAFEARFNWEVCEPDFLRFYDGL